MGNTAPIEDWATIATIVIVLIAGIAIAVLVGPEPDRDAEREWQAFLDEHPDAHSLLEADWQRRVAEAERNHQPLPPPIPH